MTTSLNRGSRRRRRRRCVDNTSGRFKLILYADPLPAKVLNAYNGKPTLLTASTSVHIGTIDEMDDSAGEACRYIELDVNIRQWNMFVRTSLSKLSPSIEGLDIEIGCCVEGRNDEEMPEQLLGCAKLSRIPWSAATEFHAEAHEDCDCSQ